MRLVAFLKESDHICTHSLNCIQLTFEINNTVQSTRPYPFISSIHLYSLCSNWFCLFFVVFNISKMNTLCYKSGFNRNVAGNTMLYVSRYACFSCIIFIHYPLSLYLCLSSSIVQLQPQYLQNA